MIWALVIAALALVALAYVTAPMRRGPRRELPKEADAVARIDERKTAALTAIVDLEEELAVGKLSEADFGRLRARYEQEALAALRELDAIQSAEAGEDDLEAEIAAARARMVCPSCGRPSPGGGRCPRCLAS